VIGRAGTTLTGATTARSDDVGPGSGPAASVAPRWPTRPEWRTAVLYVLATRAGLLLAAWLAAWLLAGTQGRISPGLGIWRRWDADIYAKIAEFGYAGAGAEPWSEAFPPLWPLLLRAVSGLGPSPTVAALGLTTLASIVAVAYLIRLVDEEVPAAGSGPTTGRRAALYLLLFPTAVFLVAGYSEALFLAGAVPAFREARRGRWPRAAAFAAVAVGARWVGLFLLLGLAVELLRQRPGRAATLRAGTALAAATAPILGFVAWLWATRGDPLYFLAAQNHGWGRTVVGPIDAFRTTWHTWSGDYASNILLAWRIEIVAAGVGIALVLVLLRRREWGYATYAGATLAVMLTSSWYYSIPRILLTLFPLVVLLARWTSGRPGRHEVVVAVLAPLATLGAIVFTRGAWFF
jgi:hypothetical protein